MSELALPTFVDGVALPNLSVARAPPGPLARLSTSLLDRTAIDVVSERLALDLPRSPAWAAAGLLCAYALGPRDWLVSGPSFEEIQKRLGDDLRGFGVIVADVSDAYERLTLSGAKAGAFLSTACSLDLRAERFRPPQCALTLFARIDVLLAARDEHFELYVERSYRRYLMALLQAAAEEFRA